jgi:hypothetical protein
MSRESVIDSAPVMIGEFIPCRVIGLAGVFDLSVDLQQSDRVLVSRPKDAIDRAAVVPQIRESLLESFHSHNRLDTADLESVYFVERLTNREFAGGGVGWNLDFDSSLAVGLAVGYRAIDRQPKGEQSTRLSEVIEHADQQSARQPEAAEGVACIDGPILLTRFQLRNGHAISFAQDIG